MPRPATCHTTGPAATTCDEGEHHPQGSRRIFGSGPLPPGARRTSRRRLEETNFRLPGEEGHSSAACSLLLSPRLVTAFASHAT